MENPDKTRFEYLFVKFVNGLRWLNRRKAKGIDTKSDMADFQEKIVQPLETKWKELPRIRKDHFLELLRWARAFDAEISIPCECKKLESQ